jgi:hypothetical protein
LLSYIASKSFALRNLPVSSTAFTQFTFSEPGICPPLSALTSLPVYSSGLLVSHTIFEGSSTESRISSKSAIS